MKRKPKVGDLFSWRESNETFVLGILVEHREDAYMIFWLDDCKCMYALEDLLDDLQPTWLNR